mgnify:CR=1 FL=1
MVSVIMSVYNENSVELSAAIDSILNQTFKNFVLRTRQAVNKRDEKITASREREEK